MDRVSTVAQHHKLISKMPQVDGSTIERCDHMPQSKMGLEQ